MMISGTRLVCRVYYTGDRGDAEMTDIFSRHTASMQMLETCGLSGKAYIKMPSQKTA